MVVTLSALFKRTPRGHPDKLSFERGAVLRAQLRLGMGIAWASTTRRAPRAWARGK